MQIETIKVGNTQVAVIQSDVIIIHTPQDALDFMMTIQYETGSDKIIIEKSAITEAFFQLRSGLAGEVLQKFINYKIKLAIVGDYSGYTSSALHDFIYESNRGKDIFFVPSRREALEKLTQSEMSKI